jgi:hypothetical protein
MLASDELMPTEIPILVFATVAVAAMAFFVIAISTATFFAVEQRSVAIVQRLGSFLREAAPDFSSEFR